ncbi:MAG: hypothetical protein FK730_03535 [Asgard group archaeon]|nr:hypothetical protein [Asgard group archaeon]
MNIRSKNLITISLIFLVLPFLTLLTFQSKDVAAESPTVSITDVTSTPDYKIDVSVEISLPGYNYDLYTQYLRLYLNQSIDTILANNYDGYNSSKEFGRQSEATFSADILSPILLSGGSGSDSGFYNITIVAITNTDEKSDLIQWSGGYYFVDTEKPEVSFINPNEYSTDVWGIYNVEVSIIDESNLSKIQFFVDGELIYEDNDPAPEETLYSWDWICSQHNVGEKQIQVHAFDDTLSSHSDYSQLTIDIIGPQLSYLEPIPPYIDSNDTLALNVSLIDHSMLNDTNPANNIPIDTVLLNYTINDGPWQQVEMENTTTAVDFYNYTFSEYPVGTKINWEIFANNTYGHYNIFLDLNLDYFEIFSVYPDHIKPVGEITYEKQIEVYSPIIVELNVTEQSPINQCLIHYQIDENDWQETSMIKTDNDTTWFVYQQDFGDTFPIFTQIHFYIWLNDSGNNILTLNNNGNNYRIKVIPSDLIAPNVTMIASPENLTPSQNITVTVEINETSTLISVDLYYTINGMLFSLEMEQITINTWSISFILYANTGDEIEIWVQAVDEFYNTGISEVKEYEVTTDKIGITHNNFFLALMLILLLIVPLVVTLLIIRPQR